MDHGGHPPPQRQHQRRRLLARLPLRVPLRRGRHPPEPLRADHADLALWARGSEGGLLKHDYSISYLVSRSLASYRGWGSLEGGYTWREGAPADQVFFNGDVGYPLPFWGALVKGAAHLELSVGEDTQREPDDRFGASAINNFNKASYLKLGGSAIFPFGGGREWAVEVGYNQWVWGRSARKYHEPYISLGRSF